MFSLQNKNDKSLKTLETILHLPLDFVTMNDYIRYIRLIKEGLEMAEIIFIITVIGAIASHIV